MNLRTLVKRTLMAGLLTMSAPVHAGDQMATDFARPPQEAKPWVYWFWLDGNLTREGIIADLEAMKRVGIGGVLIMEISEGTARRSSARTRASSSAKANGLLK